MDDNTQIQPAKVTVRHLQVMQVLQHMSEGMKQDEACALAHISQRTFQRWVSKPEMAKAIQQLAQDALTAAGVIAFNALPSAVSYQAQVANGAKGDPRDANKAAVFLRDLARDLVGQPTKGKGETIFPLDDGSEATVAAEFKPRFSGQKVRVTVEVGQSGQVIEGQSSEVESSDDDEGDSEAKSSNVA